MRRLIAPALVAGLAGCDAAPADKAPRPPDPPATADWMVPPGPGPQGEPGVEVRIVESGSVTVIRYGPRVPPPENKPFPPSGAPAPFPPSGPPAPVPPRGRRRSRRRARRASRRRRGRCRTRRPSRTRCRARGSTAEEV